MQKKLFLVVFCSFNAFALDSGDREPSIDGLRFETFETEHIKLRFEKSIEAGARRLLPRIENHLKTVEQDLKIKLYQKMPIFLTPRQFDNAFVQFPTLSSDSFSVFSDHLTAAQLASHEFVFSGDEEDAFDTFSHEVMHFIEQDQRKTLLGAVMGHGMYAPNYAPAWMSEAWAVHWESQSRSEKGRAQRSYFEQYVKAKIASRRSKRLYDFDLSRNSDAFSLQGSHYVVGSVFFEYLIKRFGQSTVDRLMTHQSGLGFESDFRENFGHSFGELYSDFADQMAKGAAEREKIKGGRVVLQNGSGRLGPIADLGQRRFLTVSQSVDRVTRAIRFTEQGQIDAQSTLFDFFHPFVEQAPLAPMSYSKGKALHFFSSQDAPFGGEAIPGLYSLDVASGAQRKIVELPFSRSAFVARDGANFYSFRIKEANSNDYVIERGAFANPLVHVPVATAEGFSSVGDLIAGNQEGEFFFAGIRPAGTWGIYAIKVGQSASVVVDSPGQDFMPQIAGEKIYFISNLDKESFQLYELSGSNLCRVGHEPFMLRHFVVSDTNPAQILAVSHRGDQDVVVDLSNEVRSCQSRSTIAAQTPRTISNEVYKGESFVESGIKGLVPATHALLPRYIKGVGLGFQVLVSGEAPYKNWSYTVGGDWDKDALGDYALGATVATTVAHPVNLRLSAFYDRNIADRFVSSARFLTTAFDATISSGHQQFNAEVFATNRVVFNPSSDLSDEDLKILNGLNSITGLGFAHYFSNVQQNRRSAGPYQGWSTVTAYDLYPSYFPDLYDKPNKGVLSLSQRVYVPTPFETHSLSIKTSEKFASGQTYVGTSGDSPTNKKVSFFSRSVNEESFGFYSLASTGLGIPGYENKSVLGNKAFGLDLTYAVPFNFLKGGLSQVLGRRWLNPETSVPVVTLFYALRKVLGEADDGSATSVTWASTGFSARWNLYFSESRASSIGATYVFAQDLLVDYARSNQFQVQLSLYF